MFVGQLSFHLGLLLLSLHNASVLFDNVNKVVTISHEPGGRIRRASVQTLRTCFDRKTTSIGEFSYLRKGGRELSGTRGFTQVRNKALVGNLFTRKMSNPLIVLDRVTPDPEDISTRVLGGLTIQKN